MAQISVYFLFISFLIGSAVATSLTQSEDQRDRRSHGLGNNILRAVGEAARQTNVVSQQNEEPMLSTASFNGEILNKISWLQAHFEEISAQNDALTRQLEESERRNQKLNLLVAKLEELFGSVEDKHDANVIGGDRAHSDTDGNLEKRIETLSEFLGNREAELVVYSPDRIESRNSSTIDELRKELPDGARHTLDFLERSLVRLSDRTQSIEADITDMKSQMVRGGPTHTGNARSANTIPERHRAARTVNAETQLPSNNILEDDASRKVAFSAAATHSQYGTAGVAQTVQFQDVMVNSGGDYVASNHTFVCSVPGWYFFTSSLRTADGKYLGVVMMKNQDYLVSMFTDASDRNTMETQSVVVQLQAGDAVWLRLGPSSDYGIFSDSYRYSTFSGFLLFKS